jgi:hypothetical protein
MSRLRRWSAFVALTLISLVSAHDLVFLAGYGFGYRDALSHTGHDTSWEATVAAVLVVGVALLGVSLWRLHRLGIWARSLRADEGGLLPSPRVFGRRVLVLSLRLIAVTALAFVIQENGEHLRVAGHLPGLAVLGSAEYPYAGLIIAAVSTVLATVATLLQWRRWQLAARIARALSRRFASSPPLRPRPIDRDRRPSSHVGRGLAVRGPPPLAFT